MVIVCYIFNDIWERQKNLRAFGPLRRRGYVLGLGASGLHHLREADYCIGTDRFLLRPFELHDIALQLLALFTNFRPLRPPKHRHVSALITRRTITTQLTPVLHPPSASTPHQRASRLQQPRIIPLLRQRNNALSITASHNNAIFLWPPRRLGSQAIATQKGSE
jgi:hypothetical protein